MATRYLSSSKNQLINTNSIDDVGVNFLIYLFTVIQVCVEGRDTVPAVFLSPSSVPASPQRRKRRASPAGPFRSRMRRTISHFTPQPLLPPDRDGTGLFMELIAGLY